MFSVGFLWGQWGNTFKTKGLEKATVCLWQDRKHKEQYSWQGKCITDIQVASNIAGLMVVFILALLFLKSCLYWTTVVVQSGCRFLSQHRKLCKDFPSNTSFLTTVNKYMKAAQQRLILHNNEQATKVYFHLVVKLTGKHVVIMHVLQIHSNIIIHMQVFGHLANPSPTFMLLLALFWSSPPRGTAEFGAISVWN